MKLPLIVAHRGVPHEKIENTIESFKVAFNDGADFIEGDFWLTKDNEIVCIHDQYTGKITKNKFKLNIINSTLVELRSFKYFDSNYSMNFFIPTLEEVLSISNKNKGLFLEVKDNRIKFIDVLKQKLTKLKFPSQNLRIISYHTNILKYSKLILPEIKTLWIIDAFYMREKCKNKITFERFSQTLKLIQCNGIVLNVESNLNENSIDKLKTLNTEICVYNVNDKFTTQKMIKLGIDYITTDFPKLIKSIISEFSINLNQNNS